ncbi:DUF4861 domain-containing protein [Muricauda sp. CAU 1633]|uniref:DUF4861 domain-containing protein n=1 Tax=Allomuricauda sp. CAU 1633 TaxID=2816036 RepID=UPI001A8C8AC8|nr:DUF4861 domain-containing protein [Muricauda sp. CAU 1633]MBO0324074.1 DUF4861 domain-containing protein [Muricauda sp. CAU 1633]
MKKATYPLLSMALLFLACNVEKKDEKTEIVLINGSSIELTDKPISINRDLIAQIDSINKYPLVISGQDTIPSQLNDMDGDQKWDELFFVANFSANEEKNLTLEWHNKAPEYPKRTGVKFGKRSAADEPVQSLTSEVMLAAEMPKKLGYQQYQTDGPMWENDKIGFRHYLDGRNAKDLFGKKTSGMSPETVGLDSSRAVVDNYHVMEDWGRDILAVGNSVGIGGYALATENELMRLGVTVDDTLNNVEKTKFNILTEGPVESVMQYSYENWKPNNERDYSVKETTAIYPGIYGYKNTVSITSLEGDENLVVGLPKIHTEKPISIIDENEKYIVLYTHDQQTYDKEWWLGMALILPKEHYLGHMEAPTTGQLSSAYLAKLHISNNSPVNYYAVAGWELSDVGFKDEAYFADYVKQLVDQLSAEVKVEIIN